MFLRILAVIGLCTVASLPTSLQFFCEVQVLSDLIKFSSGLVGLFCIYLFLRSLVPFFLLGSLLCRHYRISQVSSGVEVSYFLVCVF